MDDETPTQPGAVAIVPARGGSKRIPRKNIRPFRGRSLVERTVEMLLKAGIFERVVISTDDEEIAAAARAIGADVPFMRPPDLANDTAGTRPVIQHGIGFLEKAGGTTLSFVCCVYPAAVFVSSDDLRSALDDLTTSQADFAFSATSFSAPVQRALRQRVDGTVEPIWPEYVATRSQDLEPAYHDAGQFYWGRRDVWMTSVPIFQARSVAYLLPAWRVQDIDTPEDWERAEILHRLLEVA